MHCDVDSEQTSPIGFPQGRPDPRGESGSSLGIMSSGDPERFDPVADARPDDRPWPQLTWPIDDDIELDGATVRLSQVRVEAEAEELFDVLDHREVWANLPIDPTSAAAYARFLAERSSRPDWHIWTVRLARPLAGHDTGAIVGTTSFLDARVGDASIEIGATAYTPSVWGSAVNPECKLLLLIHAFETLGAGRVQIKTDVRNTRSQQAIARLGAHFEGVLRRHYRRSDGTVRDTVLFSITAEDWPSVRSRLQARLA